MIIATVDLPNPDRTILVMIIEKDNLDRMRVGDPITLESRAMGGHVMPKVRYPENLSLLVAYEEDDVELYKLARNGDMLALLRYLERGRTWKPDVDGKKNMFHLHKGETR
jgi:hypothetical protein